MFTVGKSVQENALIIIRLLIQRPECLGPALAGDDALGLEKVYDVTTSDRTDDVFNNHYQIPSPYQTFPLQVPQYLVLIA